MQCFHCTIKLDGWETDDDPVQEHLAHAQGCEWAISLHAGAMAQQQPGYDVDPLNDEMTRTRKATFGDDWIHESKKGWKCKVSKMVDAGWCFDPSQASGSEMDDEGGDGVTCFYCALSLDGWEPKDDPLQEHRKRSPDCAFFALVERHGGFTRGKGKSKKGGRASATSKTERPSKQSTLAASSELVTAVDAGLDASIGSDDSVVTTATAASQAPGKRKQAGRAKAPAKRAKGRKRTNTVDSVPDIQQVYPPDLEQSTPQPEKRKRGTKRTSDGVKKPQQPELEDVEMSAMSAEFPVPPQGAPSTRGIAGGRNVIEVLSSPVVSVDGGAKGSGAVKKKPAKAKKASTRKAGRPKKSSSTRSSRSSKATVADDGKDEDAVDDLERDEREIEAELERIAAQQQQQQQQQQQAVQTEQDMSKEYEPSPSPAQPHHSINRPSPSGFRIQEDVHDAPASPPRMPSMPGAFEASLESPNSSDKENAPASVVHSSSQAVPEPASLAAVIHASPTKTIRVPLAPGTPNRSPAKHPVSPPKSVARVVSSLPWEPADLDALLTDSPTSHGRLSERLADAASRGALTEDEKGLTVEDWLRLQGQKGEEALRRRCEGLVAAFERQGVRAGAVVEGIACVA